MISVLHSARRCLIRMPFYAVEVGRNPGVYETWSECQSQIHKYPGAKYKKFPTLTEALEFVKGCSGSQTSMDKTCIKGRGIWKETAGHSNSETLDCKGESSSSSSSSSSTGDEYMPYPGDDQMNDTLVTISSRSLLSFKSTLNKVKQTMGQLQEYIRHAEEQLHVLEESGKGKKRPAPSEQNDLANNSIGTIKRKKTDRETSGPVSVYTDGCCHGNQTNTRRAGIGVYWGPNHPMNVSEPLVGMPTNNRAEIQAACRAIQQALDMGINDLVLNTDSDYVIKCMTKYIQTWKRNGWKLTTGGDVKNQKDLKELDVLLNGDVNVTWVHVRGHQGIEGNEEADRLANEGALKSEIHKLD